MRIIKFLLLPAALAIVSLCWTSCYKDHFTGDGLGGQVLVTFAGQVLDESGQPLTGAAVEAGGEIRYTDKNGVFRLPAVTQPSRNAILKIRKAGFFDFSRAYVVGNGDIRPVTIQMLRKVLIGSFQASAGGTLQMSGGATLTFPAGAVNYNGVVNVFARYIDPTDNQLGFFMPGDLRAINAAGEDQILATFGMVGVEMIGQSTAQVLELAAGKEAEIKLPIQTAQSGTAPNDIPLWHYDHDQARWLEEGSATRVGNFYIGKVKHFSFWNCDAPFPLIYLKGRVVWTPNGAPISNLQVRLTVQGTNTIGHGYTDGNGVYRGGVPKGQVFTMEIMEPLSCGNTVLSTQVIGPFQDDTTLPDVALNGSGNSNIIRLTGALKDCNNQSVSEGYTSLSGIPTTLPSKLYAFPDAQGNFEYVWLTCQNVGTVTVKAYDLKAGMESTEQAVTITNSDKDLGDIVVCQSLTEFIKYILDGTAFTITEPISFTNGNNTALVGEVPGSYISMGFKNQEKAGTFPLDYLSVNNVSIDSSSVHTVTTTLTQWGTQPSDLHIGSFGGAFKDNQGKNHTINGSYQVKRN